MPLEIRELVIQAQVAQREGDAIDKNENAEDGDEKKEEKKISLPSSNSNDDLKKELKIWLLDYLEKQQRRF